MNLEISSNILKELNKENLDIGSYLILDLLDKKEDELVEEYIDLNVKNAIGMNSLIKKGYIALSNSNGEELYILTSKGVEFVNKLKD